MYCASVPETEDLRVEAYGVVTPPPEDEAEPEPEDEDEEWHSD